MLHLLVGLCKDTVQRLKREKGPAPGRNQTHDLSVKRHVLYRCATTAAKENFLGSLGFRNFNSFLSLFESDQFGLKRTTSQLEQDFGF